MKKKVAILTLPLGHNYGGIMQNYALQQVLTKLGYEPIAFDRRHNVIAYSVWQKIKIIAKLLLKGAETPYSIELKRNRALMNNTEFIQNRITTSRVLYSTEDLRNCIDENEIYACIVGSDQSWRPIYTPDIYNFFLDFIAGRKDVRKIAYACSFGTDLWEYSAEQTAKVTELIRQFDSVSVRESSGKMLCQHYLNYAHVKHTLDPTLLLTAHDYTMLLSLPEENKGLYSYVLDSAEDKVKIIDYCAEQLGLEVFKSQPLRDINEYRSGDDISKFYMPKIEDWISGFKNARFIITDSFHGTVFSIIFNKPFITVVNENRGAARFQSLLKSLGLESRLVSSIEDIDSDLFRSIDYTPINEKLADLKNDSMNFLSEALSKC